MLTLVADFCVGDFVDDATRRAIMIAKYSRYISILRWSPRIMSRALLRNGLLRKENESIICCAYLVVNTVSQEFGVGQ